MPYPLEIIGDGSPADSNFLNLSKDMNPPVPQARVFNSANISTTTGTDTALTFDSETYDNGNLHSTSANTDRLTAPITGLYHVGGNVRWAPNATGYRYAYIDVNGSSAAIAIALVPVNSAATVTIINIGADIRLVAGDYVRLIVNQNSGGNLNVETSVHQSPEFWMHRVSGYVNQGV